MGIFGRQTKNYADVLDDLKELPPVPPEEIGEVQKLAELIWDFEDHGSTTWKDVRRMHEEGFDSATRLYKDRVSLSNAILEKYEPRKDL